MTIKGQGESIVSHKSYIAPSKICGEYLHLPQIWCDWGLQNHADLQTRLGKPWSMGWNRDTGLYVLKQCPELFMSIDLDDDRILYDAAMGLISQFNLPDIRYFLEYENYEDRPVTVEERRTRLNRSLPDGHLQWVASSETMDIIEAAMLVRT